MKRPSSVIACVLFALVALSPLAAAPSDGLPLQGADLSIRFFNRTVYYPGNSSSEPILVQVLIANNGPETIRFKLADDRFFSVDFSAADTRNRIVDHTDTWLRRRTTNRQVFFRELSVEPGESYSFTENVKDYLKIDNAGIYVLDCSFFPELKEKSETGDAFVRSNRLTLEVKPSPSATATSVMPVSPTTAIALEPQPIPPDQVVTYIITARQKSHWDQFFLYLDLDQMIVRDPAKSRRYRTESENGRFTMIENYKAELMRGSIDSEISTIPSDFRIERTSYTDTEGTVTVIEWFDYRTFREKKRYTYDLTSRNGIWRVTDYTVDNLGTE